MTTLPIVTLTHALEHPDLFGRLFRGKSWGRWKTFIAALFAEPLGAEALAQYRHHTERTEPPAAPFREAALVCGRRGGKSRILALLAVYVACFRDYAPHLAPGETPVVALIAKDRLQARVLLRYVVGLLRSVPVLRPLIVDELAESVTLSNGVTIEIHTGSIASPRGRTYVGVLCDEIAYWPASDEFANPDTEVIASVRPGLASIPNSLLVMASSPYWQRGVLWQAFSRHWGKNGSRVLVWRGTTEEMNPKIDPAVIAEAYEEDPASARGEYGAQFRTDVGAFVSREVVEAAIVRGRHELPPVHGIEYFGFLDGSSGAGGDRMTLAVAHAADGIAVLDCVRGFSPPFSPASASAECAGVFKSCRVSKIHGDRWGLGWIGERFQEHGIRYEVAERAKSDLYRELLAPLNSGRIELLDHPQMIGELLNLERRVARGGRDSIDHPRGLHDDFINSAAGALVWATSGKRRVVITPEMMQLARQRPGFSMYLPPRPPSGGLQPQFRPRSFVGSVGDLYEQRPAESVAADFARAAASTPTLGGHLRALNKRGF